MSIVEFLSQPFWQRLGLTLVHFLWQGLAVAVLAGAFVRVFRLKHGNARYGAYLLAFIAMIVCPIVTFTAIDIPISPDTELVTGAESAEVVEAPSYTALPAVDILPEAETSMPIISSPVAMTDSIPLGQRISDWLNVSMPWVLVIWMVGVVVLSVRLLMGFVGVYRWRHHLEPLPERLAQRIVSLSERLGMRGFSRVFISPTVLQAMAVGYLRPMVLLPAAMVTQMQPEMLEAVIAHELAHIRRFDLWVNLAQRVTETLLFYHPAVWWLSICLRRERELCCDELAVKATGRRLTYATTLESVGRAKFMAKQPVLAAGLGQDKKPTLSRVRHILGLKSTQRNCPFWLAGVITVLFLAALVIPTTLALTNRSDEKLNDLESVVVEGIGANRDKFECGYLAWSSKHITTTFLGPDRPPTELEGEYEFWWDGEKMTSKYLLDHVYKDPEGNLSFKEQQKFGGSENWLGPQITRWRGRWSQDFLILQESKEEGISQDWSVVDNNGAKLIRYKAKNMNKTDWDYGGYRIRDYDPSKGHGLVNEEWYYPDGNQRLKHTVKMLEVIPGGWFPVEVDFKSFAITDGKVYSHNHCALDIERCSFNDKSALPAGIFKGAIDKQLKYQEKLQKYLAMELRGISDVEEAAKADKVKLGAREAVETFIAAALAGDFEKARQFADPDKAVADLEDIPEVAGGQNLWIMAVVADDFDAIAISSVIRGDHERIGPLVFSLDRKPQDGRDNWWVDDIDLETPDSTEGELKKFLEKHPKAQKVPYENKPAVQVSAQELVAKIIESERRIEDIQLHMTCTIPAKNLVFYEYDWGYDSGKEFYAGFRNSTKPGRNEISRTTQITRAFDGQNEWSLRVSSEDKQPSGAIFKPNFSNFRSMMTFNTLLGFDAKEHSRLSFGEAIAQAESISVSDNVEFIDGRPCYVIEAVNLETDASVNWAYDVRAWVDYQRDCRLLKFEKCRSISGKNRFKVVSRRVDNIKLKQVDGIWLPIEGRRTTFYTNDYGPPKGMTLAQFAALPTEEQERVGVFKLTPMSPPRRLEVDVKSIRVNKGIPPERFTIAFPDGCEVYNEFTGNRYVVGQPSEREAALSDAEWIEQMAGLSVGELVDILRDSRIGKDKKKWFAAIHRLVEIGSTAVPELVAELRQTEKPQTQSKLALTLRAIGDRKAVPGLIDGLERSGFSSDYGIGEARTELDMFFKQHQLDPAKKSLGLARPVREITIALEKLTGHTEGHDHFHAYDLKYDRLGSYTITPEIRDRQRQHRRQVAERWRKWWQANKDNIKPTETLPKPPVEPKPARSERLERMIMAAPEGSILTLAIVPNVDGSGRRPSLTKEEYQRYVEDLARNGPFSGSIRGESFQWSPIKGDSTRFRDLPLSAYKDRNYLLLCARAQYVMMPELEGKLAWGLEKVETTQDEDGKPTISIQFDEKGSELLYELTRANIGNHLAIAVDSWVLSAPTVETTVRKKTVVAGDFTEEQVRTFVEELRKGMTPVDQQTIKAMRLIAEAADKLNKQDVAKMGPRQVVENFLIAGLGGLNEKLRWFVRPGSAVDKILDGTDLSEELLDGYKIKVVNVYTGSKDAFAVTSDITDQYGEQIGQFMFYLSNENDNWSIYDLDAGKADRVRENLTEFLSTHSAVQDKSQHIDVETLLNKVRQAQRLPEKMIVEWQSERPQLVFAARRSPISPKPDFSPPSRILKTYKAIIAGDKSRIEERELTFQSQKDTEPSRIREITYVFDGTMQKKLDHSIKGFENEYRGSRYTYDKNTQLLLKLLLAYPPYLDSPELQEKYNLKVIENKEKGLIILETSKENSGIHRYTIDPDKDYNIVKQEVILPRGTDYEINCIVKKQANGLWYQVAREKIRYSAKTGKPFLENKVRITKLDINPEIPTGAFELQFPKGIKIWDGSVKDWIIVGDEEETSREPAGQEKKEQKELSKFKTTLANGVTIELVGVCGHPSEGKQWWGPDGSALEDDPSDHLRLRLDPGEDEQAREFAVHFGSPESENMKVRFDVRGSSKASWHPFYQTEERRKLKPIQNVVCRLPRELSACDVRVGVAVGEWKTVAYGGPEAVSRNVYTNDSLTDSDVVFHTAYEREGSTVIKVSHQIGDRGECRVVVFDRENKLCEPEQVNDSGGSGIKVSEARFDLAANDIKSIGLQARACQWVEFKNVSLKPNFKPDVQVEVGPGKLSAVTDLPSRRITESFHIPPGLTNVALNKPISSSDPEPIIGEIEMITDGDRTASAGSYVELHPSLQYVTIDLEVVHEIQAISMWHYHKNARVYFDVVVQIADDPDFNTKVRTVFNNDIDNSAGLGVGKDMHYVETNKGKLIDCNGVEARYIRLYSRGNNSDNLNHYVEVEVYAKSTEESSETYVEVEGEQSDESAGNVVLPSKDGNEAKSSEVLTLNQGREGSISGKIVGRRIFYQKPESLGRNVQPENFERREDSPLPGVKIFLRKDKKALDKTNTDETGHYAFEGLRPGHYTVYALKPGGTAFEMAWTVPMAGPGPWEDRGSSNLRRVEVKSEPQTDIDLHFRLDGVSISGRVTDDNGDPVSGAEVVIELCTPTKDGGEGRSGAYSKIKISYGMVKTKTDKDGRFKLGVLCPVTFSEIADYLIGGEPYRRYEVRVQAEDYSPARILVPPVTEHLANETSRLVEDHKSLFRKQDSLVDKVDLPKSQGSAITGIDLVLQKQAVVTGLVLDTQGNVLPGPRPKAWVRLVCMDSSDDKGESLLVQIPDRAGLDWIALDEAGRFRIDAVAPGNYVFEVDTIEHRNQRATNEPFTVSAGQVINDIKVIVPSEKPDVSVEGESGHYFEQRFELGKDIPVQLKVGKVDNWIIVSAKTIRFEKDGDNVGVELTADFRNGLGMEWQTKVELLGVNNKVLDVRTVTKGTHGLSDPPVMSVRKLEFLPFEWDKIGGAVRFRVSFEQLSPIRDAMGRELALAPKELIQGRITDPKGQPVTDAVVTIAEYKPQHTSHMVLKVSTNQDGYYKLGKVNWPYHIVSQRLLPTTFGQPELHQSIRLKKVFEGAQTVDLQFDEYPKGSGSLECRVVDKNGKAVERFHFMVLDDIDWETIDYKDPAGGYIRTKVYRMDVDNTEGSFTVEDLPAGNYKIWVIPKDGEYNDRRYDDVRETVFIEEGEDIKKVIEVPTKYVLYGRVLFEDGSPAVVEPTPWPGAKSSILVPMGRRARGIADIDDDGYFAVYLSVREHENLKSGRDQLMVNIPTSQEGRRKTVGKFPFEILAEDRDKAGVIRVKRPEKQKLTKPAVQVESEQSDESAQEIGGIELLDKLRSFDKSFLQSQTVVLEMQSQTKLEHMPDPESTKKRITLTSENGSIAIEREILYTSQPSYHKMTDQTVVDYDSSENLLVWRTTRSRSLLEPDFQAHQKDLILIRVSPQGDLIEQEGAPTAELYKPTDSQRFMDFMFSIWTTGRGFADSLSRITEVYQEQNGLIGIRAKGTFSPKMEGSWQMSLDPKAAYLVRSASFTSNGKDSPMFVCTTTGTKWSENCCLAETANIGWGFDLLRGDLTTAKLEKFKLEADRPLFVKLRRILREKLALNTQVIDFRISPPYRFQVDGGKSLEDRGEEFRKQAREDLHQEMKQKNAREFTEAYVTALKNKDWNLAASMCRSGSKQARNAHLLGEMCDFNDIDIETVYANKKIALAVTE
ncbi:MAG: M56 family metallopeptidase, partial [Planctomycetota bacterium]